MKNTIQNTTDKPQRADLLLANNYPQYSRSALVKLFEIGHIKQGKIILKSGDKIKPGNKITADVSELEKPIADIELPIIYEDDNVIVVDKPVGIISHARGKYWDEPSVASFIRQKAVSLEGERAGIVHRLDRATSGVMICAKNSETMRLLQKQFSQRNTKKVYYAIVKGTPELPTAIIDIALGRDPKKPQTFKTDKLGKPAQTLYEVIKSNGHYSLLKLTPKTGRTHQLRVHLKYIKHPIVGDELYGGEPATRLFLHAADLEITIPKSNRITFSSPLPDSFNDYIK
jgi:23S rRNA pseudouridine1911/1915/1917 synthase